jgi:acyl-CoA thioester hydrolase
VKRIKTRIDPRWDAIEVALPVRFNEVDSMEIVWHGHYIAWAECAREEYLRQRGLGYRRMQQLDIAAPIVRLQVEYLAPARGGETVRVICAHVPDSYPRIECFYHVLGEDGRLLCLIETVQVFIAGNGQVFLAQPPEVTALHQAIIAHERANGLTVQDLP